MPWHVALAIVLGTVLASFTDWLFMDMLVHRYYAARPEVWRLGGGSARIVVSQLLGTLATAAVVGLCVWSPAQPLAVAGLAWSAGPLPMALQNLQWMKIHPAVTASHAAGWLMRFAIAGALAQWLLPGHGWH